MRDPNYYQIMEVFVSKTCMTFEYVFCGMLAELEAGLWYRHVRTMVVGSLWGVCGMLYVVCGMFVVCNRDIFGMFVECLWRIMLVVCLRSVCRVKLTSVLT